MRQQTQPHPALLDPRRIPHLEAPRDVRLERVKYVAVDATFLAELLQMDGTFALKMTGWPEGAEVVGTGMANGGNGFVLVIHHPSFPRNLAGVQPQMTGISYEKVYGLLEPPAEEEDVDGG